MKLRCPAFLVFAACVLLSGCATTDAELTQKEKDKMAREMERANQKEARSQAQAQEKMLRDSGQRRGTR